MKDMDALGQNTTAAGRKLMTDLGEEAKQLLLPLLARYSAEAARLGDEAPAPLALLAILLLDVSTLGRAWGVEPAGALAGALGIATASSAEDAHAVLQEAIDRLKPAPVWLLGNPFGTPPGRPT